MRFTALSAAVTALLIAAGCQENSLPAEGSSGGTDQPGTGGTQGGEQDSGGSPPVTDEQPPSDPPPPVPDGGDSPAEDAEYVLPQAAVATLRYSGPAEDHVHVHAADYHARGGEVGPADDIWRECFDFRLDDRPNWCDGERFRDSWENVADGINRLDEDEYGDQDVFEAWAEQRFSDHGTDYGELTLRMRISSLPSTLEAAQASRFVTTSADWTGYPAFLSVVTGLPDGRPAVPAGETREGTLIRIYGVDEGGGNDKHDRWSEPQLLVEKTLHGNDRYDFRLPPDSPYWRMEGPVSFTIEISQWMTTTRRP